MINIYHILSYLMKKDELPSDRRDFEKSVQNSDSLTSSGKTDTDTEPDNEKDSNDDILDENKKQPSDNDNQSEDKKAPTSTWNTSEEGNKAEKVFHYGIREGQYGTGKTRKPQWVKMRKKFSWNWFIFAENMLWYKKPCWYSGIEILYDYIKFNSDQKISRKDIKIWLSKQESYTAHRPVRRRFKIPWVLDFYKNYQWDTDTANMVKYENPNDVYAYFTVFIDIFTWFLYSQALKTLTGQKMVNVMDKNFQRSQNRPNILRSDQGNEYVNREVAKSLMAKLWQKQYDSDNKMERIGKK